LKKGLIEIGFENNRSFVGLIKNYINRAAQQIAGHAGEILVTEYIEPLLDGAVEKLKMLNKIKE
jgi:hypothetical protein